MSLRLSMSQAFAPQGDASESESEGSSGEESALKALKDWARVMSDRAESMSPPASATSTLMLAPGAGAGAGGTPPPPILSPTAPLGGGGGGARRRRARPASPPQQRVEEGEGGGGSSQTSPAATGDGANIGELKAIAEYMVRQAKKKRRVSSGQPGGGGAERAAAAAKGAGGADAPSSRASAAGAASALHQGSGVVFEPSPALHFLRRSRSHLEVLRDREARRESVAAAVAREVEGASDGGGSSLPVLSPDTSVSRTGARARLHAVRAVFRARAPSRAPPPPPPPEEEEEEEEVEPTPEELERQRIEAFRARFAYISPTEAAEKSEGEPAAAEAEAAAEAKAAAAAAVTAAEAAAQRQKDAVRGEAAAARADTWPPTATLDAAAAAIMEVRRRRFAGGTGPQREAVYGADQARLMASPSPSLRGAGGSGGGGRAASPARAMFRCPASPAAGYARSVVGGSGSGSPQSLARHDRVPLRRAVEDSLTSTNLLLARRLDRKRALNYPWATHLAELAHCEADVMLETGRRYYASLKEHGWRMGEEGTRYDASLEVLPRPPTAVQAALTMQRAMRGFLAKKLARRRQAACVLIGRWAAVQMGERACGRREQTIVTSKGVVVLAAAVLASIHRSVRFFLHFQRRVRKPLFIAKTQLLLRVVRCIRYSHARAELRRRQRAVAALRSEEVALECMMHHQEQRALLRSRIRRVVRKARNDYAVRIQSMWRCHVARRAVRTRRAAIEAVRAAESSFDRRVRCLQLLVRRRTATASTVHLRLLRVALTVASAAAASVCFENITAFHAMRLQRSVRGFVARARVARLRTWTRSLADVRAEAENAADGAACRLQRWWAVRAACVRERRKDKRGNATKIQAVWRGRRARTLLQELLRAEDLHVAQTVRSEASVHIQKVQRGVWVRTALGRLAARRRDATERRVQEERTDAAARTIQAAALRRLALCERRRRAAAVLAAAVADTRVDRAAARIQACARLLLAARRLRRRAASVAARSERRVREEQPRYAAAACVQRAWRRAAAAKALRAAQRRRSLQVDRRVFDEDPVHTAAARIQRRWRVCRARAALAGRRGALLRHLRCEEAAGVAQAFAKARLSRGRRAWACRQQQLKAGKAGSSPSQPAARVKGKKRPGAKAGTGVVPRSPQQVAASSPPAKRTAAASGARGKQQASKKRT